MIQSFKERLQTKRTYQFAFFGLCMIILFSAYWYITLQLNRRFEIIENDFSWVIQVDSVDVQNRKTSFTGWAFQLEEDASFEKYEIILRNIDNDKRLYPKMTYSTREDVNSYFLCEYDYRDVGFSATITNNLIDNQIYEIILRPSGSRRAYSTGIYFFDGAIMYVNPKEWVSLEATGTELDKIISEGTLRVYQPEQGMYVYQHDGYLYWIAEKWYAFDNNNDTLVQYQMFTSQIENLPEERLKFEWYWDNISFWFCENEIVEWNTGKYRVAREKIPTQYSLTKIVTGRYKADNEWYWKVYFYPFYEFSVQEKSVNN